MTSIRCNAYLSLVGGATALIVLLVVVLGGCCFAFRLVNDFHHLLLEGLSLLEEAVPVPDEIDGAGVVVVTLHAPLEEAEDVAVVRVLSEGETTAVVHELLELGRLILAQ